MLGITTMPGGCGFGNRFLYYYNLRQEAYKRECDSCCIPWDGHQLFEGDLLGQRPSLDNIEQFEFCLGEKFYSYEGISTREVFKLKLTPRVQDGACAVHFRGTDFHQWNPASILDPSYYLNSIEEVKDASSGFILFTDDLNLESYRKVLDFLKDEKLPVAVGENSPDRSRYITDFSIMSECDYIISSPSTFSIAAGTIGKHKKIIHSQKWVSDRVQREDKFWVDLHNGGNQDYSTWRLI